MNIIHIDMNAFYASCHQAVNPALRGRPVLVAGDPKKRSGIVLTASYEARKFGVKTAMPNWQARKLCPHAIFIKPDYRLYVDFSDRFLEILNQYTPVVERYSIDEAWMDVSGCENLFGPCTDIARIIQQRIWEELNLPCSLGISSNKLLSKMASNMKKPRGLTVLNPENIPEKIWPLPIGELIGIGRNMANHLEKMNIKTIGDLARMPVEILEDKFGIRGRCLHDRARGIDNSPVNPTSHESAKSIGHSTTLPKDLDDIRHIQQVLLGLAELVGKRIRQEGYVGKTVTVIIRKSDFTTVTRSRTINPTNLTEDIYINALKIFEKYWDRTSKIRLLGISLSNLQKNIRQLSFLERNNKLEKLNYVIDDIQNRFGYNAIFRAKLLKNNLSQDRVVSPWDDGYCPSFRKK